jgi:hypothetical protein
MELRADSKDRKTVLDGVYTASQAERGKAAYAASCASCHRADLTGFSGPPLKDDLFMDRWREFNVEVVFNLIRNTMPANSPGTLSEDKYLDILAYILQANNLPAGSKNLSVDMLGSTLLVGKDGPKPLPGSAQVEVVGCMTLDSGNGWFLTSAGEPARTIDAFTIAPEELKDAGTRPLGAFVFRLENLPDIVGFNIDAAVGKKMEAKGILVRQPKGDRINVTAIQAAAAGCDH